MAKSKPNKKIAVPQKKSKSKPAKPAPVAKKDNKLDAKKQVLSAKKSVILKPSKQAVHQPIKKADVKHEKPAKIEVKSAPKKEQDSKNNALASKPKPAVSKPTLEKVEAKVETKTKSKIKKPEKRTEEEFDDSLIDDEFGESEIAEYEEELKAVEDEDDDLIIETIEEEEVVIKDEEVYLTDSEGRRLCRVRDCDQVATVDGYCRYHYLLLWKKIQTRKHILIDGKLEKYVEDLMARYPDKFLEVIRKDLKSEKDFLSVIQEMELDDSALNENDSDSEDEAQSFADEIRGIGEAPSLDEDGDY